MKNIVAGVAILLGALAGVLMADDVGAAGQEAAQAQAEAGKAMAPPHGTPEDAASGGSAAAVDLMADMDFRRWPTGRFYASFNGRIEALSATHGQERRKVLLDLAELYLGQVMLGEAKSVLNTLTPENGAADPRWQALNDAARLLAGQSVTASPLALPERPDRGLWLTLNAIAEGDEAGLRDNIEAGFAGLAYQGQPVARTLLPILTEAAIELHNEPLSTLGLALLREVPDLSESPTGYYLRGRDAQSRGNMKSAVEAFFEAAKGWDRYAARGRVALADMALSDGSRGALLAARDVLENGSDAWRGDGYELLVLQRLADVYSRLDEPVGALMTYGKVMLRFPGTPEAAEAGRNAVDDLDKVYGDGAAGRLPLGEWAAIHLNLVPSYRYFPDFAAKDEILADRALEIGGTVMAATEYQRTLIMLKDLQALSDQEIPQARFDEVRFKLAQALARGGRWQKARKVLGKIDVTSDADMRDRVSRLMARILSQLGDADGLLRTTVVDPDADNLREMGRAMFQKDQWSDAATIYRTLWDRYPDRFPNWSRSAPPAVPCPVLAPPSPTGCPTRCRWKRWW